jgi:MoaA/NifB/PqqE/SkfB family radical SAM enzyme
LRDKDDLHEGDLPTELIPPIVAISRRARETVLFGYGEPLVSSVFFQLLQEARSGRLSFTTNGVLMTRQTIDSIMQESQRPIYSVTFSIDGIEPSTYHAIRRGPALVKIWDNLATLVEQKRKKKTHWPEIWINFVAMRRNVEELPELVRQAAEKGVSRINVFHLVVWDPSYQEESLLNDPDLTRSQFGQAAVTAAAVGIHLDLPVVILESPHVQSLSTLPRCYHPWSYTYIRKDGTVQACCYSDNLVMGNLHEKSFAEIWNGEAYCKLRDIVNRKPPVDCRRCETRFRYSHSPDDRATYLKFSNKTRLDQ